MDQVQSPVSGAVPHSQDATSPQQNAAFPILRHNTPMLQTQQHQCTGTNMEQTSILALTQQKKKPKKKKKKKKDEEPKLDLANIMKLSGEWELG